MRHHKQHDGNHLILNERKIIQMGIENGSTKVAIAKTIGKDPTTVAKEIEKHRIIHPRNTYNNICICIYIWECKKRIGRCSRYREKGCKRRDRSPGACNKCENSKSCRLDKFIYDAEQADKSYRENLVDSRIGVNLIEDEKKMIGKTLKPLMDNGQSIYQIKSSHPEIKQCEKTLYSHVESGIFKEEGIDVFSLKEKVQRKYKKIYLKKRKDPVNYIGKTYKDYLIFKEENSAATTTEMDIVYNSPGGPYIQTFIIENIGFMFGYLHYEKTSLSMCNTFNLLQENLGIELFSKLHSLILTDRGTEFANHSLFTKNNDGTTRLNIFYCDSMQSCQKPHVENNYNYIRDILPNEISLDFLTQDDLFLMFSHINSTPRAKFQGRTPIEMLKFFYPLDYAKIMKAYNLIEIKRDEVILKPHLLRHKK